MYVYVYGMYGIILWICQWFENYVNGNHFLILYEIGVYDKIDLILFSSDQFIGIFSTTMTCRMGHYERVFPHK